MKSQPQPATEDLQSLNAFIQANSSEVIGEFTAFARTLMPTDSPMTEKELRDHSKELLLAVAVDLRTAQTSPRAIPEI